MSDERIEAYVVNRNPPLAAAPGLPPERLSPGSAEPTAVAHSLELLALVEQCQREVQAYRRGEPSAEAYGLELLRRALVQGDQDAWAGVQQCLGELVIGWLRRHPGRETACRWESEENYVALAFERFWQATAQQRVVFKNFAGALVYLRASLHGAILDTLRAYSRSKQVPMPLPGEPGEPYVEDQTDSSEVWEVLQTMLQNGRERRLAYLLYHCGLKPREIVHFCPQEWSDIQEIYCLRPNIIERVRRNLDQLRWQLDPGELL
jgi:DNA-directed RNA polymerase specialized sigma24 family protein